MKKWWEWIIDGVCVAFLGWLLISWMCITAKNCLPNPTYSDWNALIAIERFFLWLEGVMG